MMQMLSAGGLPVLADGVRAADTDNPRGYFEYEPVKRTRQDPSWLAAAPGKAVKMVHLLLRDLPTGYKYQVIVMRRPMQEILSSQRVMLDRLGRQGASLPAAQLGDLFHKQLSQLEAWLPLQPHFSAIKVEYHDCLHRSASVATEVNRFLGGTLNESAMAAAVDPSLYRQRI